VRRLIIERFGDEIPFNTLWNWKSDIEGQREKYNLLLEYIKEVLGSARAQSMVLEEEAKGVAYGLVTTIVGSTFHKLLQELHIPLGQPDRYPLPLTPLIHPQHLK